MKKEKIEIFLSSTITQDEEKQTYTFCYWGEMWVKNNVKYIAYRNEEDVQIYLKEKGDTLEILQYSNPLSKLTFIPNQETPYQYFYGGILLNLHLFTTALQITKEKYPTITVHYQLLQEKKLVTHHHMTIEIKEVS